MIALSPGWNLIWSLFAFALLVLFFIAINWLGLVLTILLLALVLGITLGIKYGWFTSALQMLTESPAQQPGKTQEHVGGFGLTPPEYHPLPERPSAEPDYRRGYQAQPTPMSGRGYAEAQPKQDSYAYDQPQVQCD